MDREIIANIKSLGIDMIKHAGSGHSGIVLSAAPIIYTLYAKHICVSTSDPNWFNRDRFIMSAGHGSALLYSTLFYAGYAITIDDLKRFRHIDSVTPGHPEYGKTPGVDMTTGPLGQGIASAVGMAMGEKYLEKKLEFPRRNAWEGKRSLIDHKIYVLCGDGDLMEGISYEACSLAGTLNLDNLIVLYDSNRMSLDGTTEQVFDEDVRARFAAMGWHTDYVKDGNDVKAIDKAITKAKNVGKPSLIEIRTILGEGSLLQNTNTVHGQALTDLDVKQLKMQLQIPDIPFYVNEEARDNFRKQLTERSNIQYEKWATNYREVMQENILGDSKEYEYLFKKQHISFSNLSVDLKPEIKDNLRNVNQTVMNEISKVVPNLIGGTADLASSTKVTLLNEEKYTKENYTGKNIYFGVREHAMGAILNGLSFYHFRPFGATYLSFADYVKPAMRMSSLMELPVTYIFTHDSILIGPDGPTHQPIEQLDMLRAMPNMNVYRPADGHELIGCWNKILKSDKTPSSLILSRNENSLLEETKIAEVEKGGYVVRMEKQKLNGVIIATGTELHTALYIARELYEKNKLDIRVVSIPCQELFLKQDKAYQEEVLPVGYKKVIIEASSGLSWQQFVYNRKYLLTINKYGASGTKDEVLEYCDFDYNSIKNRVLELFR